MAKIEQVISDDYSKFVWDGINLRTGESHQAILVGMGWPDNREEIKLRLKNTKEKIDMGMIARDGGIIFLALYSSTFSFPPQDKIEVVRQRTVKQLSDKYTEEIIKAI